MALKGNYWRYTHFPHFHGRKAVLETSCFLNLKLITAPRRREFEDLQEDFQNTRGLEGTEKGESWKRNMTENRVRGVRMCMFKGLVQNQIPTNKSVFFWGVMTILR